MTSQDDASDPTVVKIREALSPADASHAEAAKLMKKLECQGWRQQRIADAVGVSKKTVGRHVRWFDLPEPRPPYGEQIHNKDDHRGTPVSPKDHSKSGDGHDNDTTSGGDSTDERKEGKGQPAKDPVEEAEDAWAFAGSFLATAVKTGIAPASVKTRKNLIRDCRKAIELMESAK